MIQEKISKAGAIILSSMDKKKIALLYRARENDWSFPKGHIDQGENSSQTMIREIYEETGLTVHLIKTLPDFDYIHANRKSISTKMFLVVSENDSQLKSEFEGDAIEWIPYDNVIQRLSYDNLKKYFTSILPILSELS